jgi:hypothetical protein
VYNDKYNIIQNSFPALKISWDLLSHSFLPWTINRCPFYCLYSVALSRMLYTLNHTLCSLFKLVLFTWPHAFKFSSCFFVAWELILFYHWITFFCMDVTLCLSIQDILDASEFGLLWITLLEKFICWFLYERKFPTHVSKYQGVWLLDHMCLVLKETENYLPKWLAFCFPPAMNEHSCCSMFSAAFDWLSVFWIGHSTRYAVAAHHFSLQHISKDILC